MPSLQRVLGGRLRLTILLGFASFAAPSAAAEMSDGEAAFSNLWAYAGAAGSLWVYETQCHTGRADAVRADAREVVSRYVKGDKLDDFIDRTFENRVRRSSVIPESEPCNSSYLNDYRRMVPNARALAIKSMDAAKDD